MNQVNFTEILRIFVVNDDRLNETFEAMALGRVGDLMMDKDYEYDDAYNDMGKDMRYELDKVWLADNGWGLNLLQLEMLTSAIDAVQWARLAQYYIEQAIYDLPIDS